MNDRVDILEGNKALDARPDPPESAPSDPGPRAARATAIGAVAGLGDYDVRAVADWRELDRWRDEWERLATSTLEASPAAEHWVLAPALRYLGTGTGAHVVIVTRRAAPGGASAGALCGVFPIALRKMPGFRTPLVEIWHHMYAMSAPPLLARSEAAGCLQAFLRWLQREMPAAVLLKVPELRIGGPFHACLAEVLADMRLDFSVEACWSRAWFRPARDAETYIAGLGNARHRKEWRRLERRLSERGPLTYDELQPDGDVRAWIDAFATLEAAGWKGAKGTAFASNRDHLAWLHEVGAAAFARGRLMMLALRAGGETVAIKLNVLGAEGGYAFKIAYNEHLEKFSPGVLLELENVRRLHGRPGIEWMDSLAAPGHSLAERVWSDKAAFASLLIAPGRLAGRLVLAARPMLRLAKRAARRPA